MTFYIALAFVFAISALRLYRVLGNWSGLALSLFPLGVLIHLISQIPQVASGQVILSSIPWVPSLGFSFSFQLDGLSLLFALIISFIGFLIIIYSQGYFDDNKKLGLFYFFLLIFMAAMLGVVLSDNILTMFVFWELTSLSSYFLIGFHNSSDQARESANRALLITAGGGLCLMAGLILLGIIGQNFHWSELLQDPSLFQNHSYLWLAFAFIGMGAITKSAQFPFHFWLPSAMTAPTPASAYLHSATMVKAGIYLLARTAPLFSELDLWSNLLVPLGSITMLIGAYMSFMQNDLKKILAYSTVSSLGILTALLGIGSPLAMQAALFFLLAHSLAKGALFLVAGSIDHATGTRDINKLSGLKQTLPLLCMGSALAAFSKIGLIPFFGFLAKELILKASLKNPALSGFFLVAFVIASIFLCASIIKMAIKPFLHSKNIKTTVSHAVSPLMLLGVVVLSVFGLALAFLRPALYFYILEPALKSVMPSASFYAMKLWPGFNLAFALSLLSLALGTLLFLFAYKTLPLWHAKLAKKTPMSEKHWFEWSIIALKESCKTITNLIQNGKQNNYVRYIILTFIAFFAWVKYKTGIGLPLGLGSWDDIAFYEWGLCIMMAGAAISCIFVKKMVEAVISLGIVGYGSALLFALYSAPDLAITQILVETLTLILFLFLLPRLPHPRSLSHPYWQTLNVIIAIGSGLIVTSFLLILNQQNYRDHLAQYFLKSSYSLAHARNVVNAIIVDFRAIDTLGEITVLAIAALGVIILLRIKSPKEDTHAK